jgi:hypothetical protein
VIGGTAEYVKLVASALPGQTWDYYVDELPLAIGLQLRNASLFESGVDLVSISKSSSAKANEILGEHAKDWS